MAARAVRPPALVGQLPARRPGPRDRPAEAGTPTPTDVTLDGRVPPADSVARPRKTLTLGLCNAKLIPEPPRRRGRIATPDRPEETPMRTPWIPCALRVAPRLDPEARTGPPRPRSVLLINPFYPKDPHASFGKHVLTPSLALTSLAGATPPDWEVSYWDENLLQGPPPCDPFPRVVGITVHLTFAERAYELAGWYRRRGAPVVMGGLHTLSCPE